MLEEQERQCRMTRRSPDVVDFLQQEINRRLSPDVEPLPSCPTCRGQSVASNGHRTFTDGVQRPCYACRSCGDTFNRLTGTVLAHRRYGHRISTIVPLLPHSISCAEAARRLDLPMVVIQRAVQALRLWLLALDPSGRYERAVRLGGPFTPARPAPVRENPTLTRLLLTDFDAIHSDDPNQPAPACPYCAGSRVNHPAGESDYPRFYCLDCRRLFNRRTGTPYSRNRRAAQQRALIRYLSLPLPIHQLAALIEVSRSATTRLVRELHVRCLELDPSGRLAAAVQAGAQPGVDTPCLYCGTPDVRVRGARGRCGTCKGGLSPYRAVRERDGLLEAGPWQWLPLHGR
jgi:transposase-like protein